MFDDTKVVFRMEEGHTIQWSKEKKRKKKDERTRNDLYVQNTTMKTKDSANPTKTRKG
jgi:hypothetical protein